MAISVNYPTPVYVNGFICRNCTDVDYAKQHIDPAHPKDGPYGIDTPSSEKTADKLLGKTPAGLGVAPASQTPGPGLRVNLLV